MTSSRIEVGSYGRAKLLGGESHCLGFATASKTEWVVHKSQDAIANLEIGCEIMNILETQIVQLFYYMHISDIQIFQPYIYVLAHI